MDNKTFVNRLAKQLSCDTKAVQQMIAAFATILRDSAADLDTIAIPGFGNFVAMKRQERVVTDRQTGKRTLVPPQISVEFVAGAKLKKQIAHE